MRRLGLCLLAVLCVVGWKSCADRAAGVDRFRRDHPRPDGWPGPHDRAERQSRLRGASRDRDGRQRQSLSRRALAWLLDGATQTAAIATPQANAYTVTLSVPDDAAPGAAKICATVTGTAQAEFACAPFTIDAPPPGSVSGQTTADLDGCNRACGRKPSTPTSRCTTTPGPKWPTRPSTPTAPSPSTLCRAALIRRASSAKCQCWSRLRR